MKLSIERVTHVSCMVLLFAWPAAGQVWTEREAIARFMETSPLVEEARARADSASADARARAAPANPTISYRREGVGATDFIEAEQDLPLSGRIGLLRQAARAAENAARADAEARIWTLRTDVRLAFTRAMAGQEGQAVVISTLAQLDELIAILRKREEEGEGSRFDRLRAERERAEAHADLVSARVASRRALGDLSTFYPTTVAVGPRLQGHTAPAPLPQSRDTFIARALAARADYRAEAERIARFDQEVQAAGRLAIPELALNGGAKRVDLGQYREWGGVFGISMSLPLFARGGNEAERARADASASRFRLEALRHEVVARVAAAFDVAQEAVAGLTAFDRDATSAGTELLSIARLSYEEGEIGVLELLDAWRIDRQSTLRALALRAEARLAQIALEGVVGEEVVP